jgi:hypothetical protein
MLMMTMILAAATIKIKMMIGVPEAAIRVIKGIARVEEGTVAVVI